MALIGTTMDLVVASHIPPATNIESTVKINVTTIIVEAKVLMVRYAEKAVLLSAFISFFRAFIVVENFTLPSP